MERQQSLLQLPQALTLIGLGALATGHVDLLQVSVAQHGG